jgi:hypothetical protein
MEKPVSSTWWSAYDSVCVPVGKFACVRASPRGSFGKLAGMLGSSAASCSTPLRHPLPTPSRVCHHARSASHTREINQRRPLPHTAPSSPQLRPVGLDNAKCMNTWHSSPTPILCALRCVCRASACSISAPRFSKSYSFPVCV